MKETTQEWRRRCISRLICRDMLHAACSLYREHLHSALLGGILYSAPALCIPYDSFFGLSYLCWASFCIVSAPAPCILHVSHSCTFGADSAFCILHLHPASGTSSQLWARFCILHPASASYIGCQCTALGPILHSAFCICILHRVPVHSFGADSAFCILHLHPSVRGGNNTYKSVLDTRI